MLGECGNIFIRKSGGSRPTVPITTQQTQDGMRIHLFAFDGNLAQNLLNRSELFALVVNDKVFLVTDAIDELPQDSDTEGVECAKSRALRLLFVPIP
jgi:hypothetical protein